MSSKQRASSVSRIKAFILPINFSIRFFRNFLYPCWPVEMKSGRTWKASKCAFNNQVPFPLLAATPRQSQFQSFSQKRTLSGKNEENFFALLWLTEHLQLKVKSSLKRQKSWGKMGKIIFTCCLLMLLLLQHQGSNGGRVAKIKCAQWWENN